MNLTRHFLAGDGAAAQPHIDQLRHGGAGGNILEAALAQDRGFERELRRQSGANLLVGRRRAGLVVEHGVASVLEQFDAVGPHRELELLAAERDEDAAADLGIEPRQLGAPRGLEARQPFGDAQKARPPERPGLGEIRQRLEMPLADLGEHRHRIVWQLVRERLGELADAVVDQGAAIGGAGRRVDRVERLQA